MKRVVAISLFVLLAGCATQNQTQSTFAPVFVDHKYNLYGKLEKHEDGYHFSEYAESYLDFQPWVRLSDMAPMWNTEKESCLTGLASRETAGCKTANEALFRSKSLDFTPTTTTAYLFMSLLSFGLWATMPPAAVEFNQRAYSAAIVEARRKLNAAYEGIGESYVDHLDRYNASMIQLDAAYAEIVPAYNPKAVPAITLRDQSGLFKQDASAFRDSISLSPNTLVSRDDLAPVRAKAIDSLIILAQERNRSTVKNLRQAASTVPVRCRDNTMYNVSFAINCPEHINSAATEFPVEVIVKAVSLHDVVPQQISEEDDFVRVTLKDGEFYLSNKTHSYITVDSISFYHNGKIATSSNIGGELAPQAEVRLVAMNRLPIDRQAISFGNVTKTAALAQKITYGVALKYKVTSTNKENTLFKTREYRLADLI